MLNKSIQKNIFEYNKLHNKNIFVLFYNYLNKSSNNNILILGKKPVFEKLKNYFDNLENNYYYYNSNIENIVKELDLFNQTYYDTAAYVHFGREEFSWEKIKYNVKI